MTEQLCLWLPAGVEREATKDAQPRATTTAMTQPLAGADRRRTAARSWGSVRPARNGRFQARFPDPSRGGLLSACGTYATREEAEAALEAKQAALKAEPQPAADTFAAYSKRWLEQRTALAPRTRELYDQQLRDHLLPAFGNLALDAVASDQVRAWHAELSRRHQVTAAKCYRLLRCIYSTAVDDEVVVRNPCRIKGGGQESSPERPIASAIEIRKLVGAAPEHFRFVVLCASWLTLRRGEILGLRRGDFDLERGTVRISRAIVGIRGQHVEVEPKTKAGRRTIAIPSAILPDIRAHLERFVAADAHGWAAVGEKGNRLTIEMTERLWRRTREAVGLEHLRLHDLRHSGAVFVAATGAPTKQIMARLGHSSMRAAMLYQHAVVEQDQAIADGLSQLIAG